jgi:hypothetical protein
MLCNNDFDQEIKLDAYRSVTTGNHKLLGTSYFTLNDLKNGMKNLEFKNNSIEIKKFE